MKFYAAGGMYPKGDQEVFKLVHPTNGKPYVWPEHHPDGCDGASLHILTRHHASTYLISPDGKSMTCKYIGDFRDLTDPKTVTLDAQQQADIAEGVAKATRDLEAAGVPL